MAKAPCVMGFRVTPEERAAVQAAAKLRGITITRELLSGRWAHLADPRRNPNRISHNLGPPPPHADLLLELVAIKAGLMAALTNARRHHEVLREARRVRLALASLPRLVAARASDGDADAAHIARRCREICEAAAYVVSRLKEADPAHPRQTPEAIAAAVKALLPRLDAALEGVAASVGGASPP